MLGVQGELERGMVGQAEHVGHAGHAGHAGRPVCYAAEHAAHPGYAWHLRRARIAGVLPCRHRLRKQPDGASTPTGPGPSGKPWTGTFRQGLDWGLPPSSTSHEWPHHGLNLAWSVRGGS